ncbi:MAG TPA: glycosyltransferase family 2 protein, partial [Pararobbsia sp.]|nr:glycosyltransferase family 2 protein [Pararobbsia sp.]
MNSTDRSEPGLARMSLSISVVVFRPDLEMLARTLSSLDVACKRLRSAEPNVVLQVYLIDNGGLPSDFAVRWASEALPCFSYTVKTGHGNIGYGRGHNLAIAELDSDYHLVLNPDIEMQPDAL